MTDWLKRREIRSTVDSILSQLDDAFVRNRIDHPIDLATLQFRNEHLERGLPAEGQIVAQISKFVRHLTLHGTTVHQNLLDTQATAEAIHILDETFPRGGYVAALQHVNQLGRLGLEDVFAHITNDFKARERRRHFRQAFSSHVDPLDWELKRSVAEEFIHRWRDFLPPEIVETPTCLLTDAYEQIVSGYLGALGDMAALLNPTPS